MIGLQSFVTSWKDRLDRMDGDRVPKLLHQYKPTGTQDVGRARKRAWEQNRSEGLTDDG